MANDVETRSNNGSQLPAVIPQLGQAALIRAMAESKEVEGMFAASQHFKRDITDVKKQVMELCSVLSVAEEALYSYKKGGAIVEGPSIDLIQDIAGLYGRIKSGWFMLDQNFDKAPGFTTVTCYAIDYQALSKSERTIIVPHFNFGRVLTDPRDIYETVANVAQRRTRSCMEALIRTDILKDAVDRVVKTLMEADPRPLQERIKTMIDFFGTLGVNEAMIKKWNSSSNVDSLTLTQLVKLRAIAKSIKDGAPVSTFFDAALAPRQAAKPAEPDKKEEAKKAAGNKPKPPAKKEEVKAAPEPPKETEAPKEAAAESAPPPTNIPASTPEATDAPPEAQLPEAEAPQYVDAEEIERLDRGDDWSAQFS